MANILPNEIELFKRIKDEKITIDPGIVDFLYNYIKDDINEIDIFCRYYVSRQEPMPPYEAQRILMYTRDIEFIISNITKEKLDSSIFPDFKTDMPLDPLIRDLLTYHLGNDIYCVNLIVQEAIEPSNKKPSHIPMHSLQKILEHTLAIKEFMDKLKAAVSV